MKIIRYKRYPQMSLLEFVINEWTHIVDVKTDVSLNMSPK